MDTSSLTFQAFRNALYNIIGFLWPLAFTLFVTPLIIFGLGVKEYGIYLFVTSVISFMGLLDLGLGAAVAKHLSYYLGRKDEGALARVAHSANSLFFAIACIGLVITAVVAFGGTDLLPERFAAYEQYSILFVIGGAIFFLTNVFSTSNSVLVAAQRFDIISKITMLNVALSSLSMLAIVKTGGSLTHIFLAQLIAQAVSSITIFWQARKVMPVATFRFAWDKEEIRHCYRFGLIFFVNNVATSALASLDRLIIPLFVGPSNLTYYSLPGNVTTKIPGVANTLGASIFPTVSLLDGSNSADRIRTLYMRYSRIIMVIAAALTVTSIAFAYKILAFWLDAEIASKAWGVLIVLALTNFILALFNPLSNVLLGLGKVRLLTIASISMALLNIALLFILLPLYGIMGAAWAYLISVLPVAYFVYRVEKHDLGLVGRRRHYRKTLLGVSLTSAIIFVANLGLGLFAVDLISLLFVGGTSFILFLIFYKKLGFFEPEDWHDIERFAIILCKRLRIERLSHEIRKPQQP